MLPTTPEGERLVAPFGDRWPESASTRTVGAVVGVHRGDDDEWQPAEAHYVYISTGPPASSSRWAPILTATIAITLLVFLWGSWPANWVAAGVFVVALVARVWLSIRNPPKPG